MARTLDPLQMLKAGQGARSMRAYAKEIGISAAYLSDIYRARRGADGPKILTYLGLEKVTTVRVEYKKQ